jgi:hypothetical protein
MDKIKEQWKLLKYLLTDIEFNRTHAEHAFVAILHQVVIVAIFGWWWLIPSVWAGAALGAGVFFGREHAQAEMRVLRNLGYQTLSAAGYAGYNTSLMAHNLKWWDQDSILDQIVPLVCVVVIASITTIVTI